MYFDPRMMHPQVPGMHHPHLRSHSKARNSFDAHHDEHPDFNFRREHPASKAPMFPCNDEAKCAKPHSEHEESPQNSQVPKNNRLYNLVF